MRVRLFVAVLLLFCCTACTTNVAPIATTTGTINPADNSLTEIRDGVAFTVKLDELSVAAYPAVDNITAFHVAIDNRTDQPVFFPSRTFLLKDGGGRQYPSISPERVRDIVSKDTVYLIPYPYVGYYYLEDQMRVTAADTFSSSLPFYAEYHPQDIFTRALSEEPIHKQSKVAGVIYFIADLEQSDYAEVQVFAGGEAAGEPLASFPFAIEK